MTHIYEPSQLLLQDYQDETSINIPDEARFIHTPPIKPSRSRRLYARISPYFPLILSGVYMFFCTYFNNVLQVYGQYALDDKADTIDPNPLPDIGHRILPHWAYTQICDYWVIAAYVITFLRFVFVPKLRVLALRRYFTIHGTMFLLRGVSIFVTQLTVPQAGCEATVSGSPWVEALWIMTGHHQTCSDIMFSGHTTALTVLALIWTNYTRGEEWRACYGQNVPGFCLPQLDAVNDPISCTPTVTLVWLYAIAGYVLIIDTHFHYTVDTFIAFVLTQLLFRWYHSYLKTALERDNFFSRFIVWYEGLMPMRNEIRANSVNERAQNMKEDIGSLLESQKQVAGIPVAILDGKHPHPSKHENINDESIHHDYHKMEDDQRDLSRFQYSCQDSDSHQGGELNASFSVGLDPAIGENAVLPSNKVILTSEEVASPSHTQTNSTPVAAPNWNPSIPVVVSSEVSGLGREHATVAPPDNPNMTPSPDPASGSSGSNHR